MIKIYLANLGKYNEMELVGKWVTLPLEDTLENILKSIGVEDGTEYEEFAIHDYESDMAGLNIHEYEDINALNELSVEIEALSDYERKKVAGYMEIEGNGLNGLREALEALEDITMFDVDNERELGEVLMLDYIDSLEVDDVVARYFDYEAYGRDYNIENSGGFTSYGYVRY